MQQGRPPEYTYFAIWDTFISTASISSAKALLRRVDVLRWKILQWQRPLLQLVVPHILTSWGKKPEGSDDEQHMESLMCNLARYRTIEESVAVNDIALKYYPSQAGGLRIVEPTDLMVGRVVLTGNHQEYQSR